MVNRKGARHDAFVIENNGTFSEQISIKDSNGDLVPIPNVTVQMDIRQNPEDTSTILTLTEANGRVTNDNTGVILLEVTKEDTADLDFKTAYYDIRLVNSVSGDADFILYGQITNERTVTR